MFILIINIRGVSLQYKIVDDFNQNNYHNVGVYLVVSDWDDWFTFKTTYIAWFSYDNKTLPIYLGGIKIGDSIDSKPRPEIPKEFTQLSNGIFSLGTDESYYIELNTTVANNYREEILNGLNDIAYSEDHFNIAKNTYVFTRSLSRDVPVSSIKGRYRRLANGDATLTNYNFSYSTKHIPSTINAIELDFKVTQDDLPPSNIHTIIGRNGVGKSFLLSSMIKSLVSNEEGFELKDEDFNDSSFSNLLSVNFSSFEKNEIFKNNSNPKNGIIYHHIGSTMYVNKKNEMTTESSSILKNLNADDMDNIFYESITECISKKPKRWAECIALLNSDPVFENIGVVNLIHNYRTTSMNDYKDQVIKVFEKLSSGHKIVLLTLCKLIELSEEKALIILDEPEMHLHPPLLGSFIRSISYLLKKVNGVAIIATHSPIVLQEVPNNCVWILDRNNNVMKVYRPEMETFGENIASLTREVFQYEVTNSGFHRLLKDSVEKGLSYEEVVKQFNDRLGTGALGILRVLLSTKGSED